MENVMNVAQASLRRILQDEVSPSTTATEATQSPTFMSNVATEATHSPTYLSSTTNEEEEYDDGPMTNVGGYIVMGLFISMAFAWVIYMAWEKRKRNQAVKKAAQGGMNMDYLLEESEHDREQALQRARDIQAAIREGAYNFYTHEAKFIALLFVGFCGAIFVVIGSSHGWQTEWKDNETDSDAFQNEGEDRAPSIMNAIYTVIAMTLGCGTAWLSVYYSCWISCTANTRIVIEATHGIKYSYMAFIRAGSSIGMLTTGLGVMVLFFVLVACEQGYGTRDHKSLYLAVSGFALGASYLALITRFCASVYTRSSSVGARMALMQLGGTNKIQVDDPRNPAVIADHVGLILSYGGGSVADLFGSFAVAVVSAMVLSSTSSIDLDEDFHNMGLPLVLMASSVISTGISVIAMSYIRPVREKKESERVLKSMIPLANAIQTVMAYIFTSEMLPDNIRKEDPADNNKAVQPIEIFACVALGIWLAYFLAKVQEYYVSPRKTPVRQMGEACKSGAASTLIFGLSIGFSSTVALGSCLAVLIYLCTDLADYFGLGYCAVGVVGVLGMSIMIECSSSMYGNAMSIARMSGQSENVLDVLSSLSLSAHSVTSISKAVSIGAAVLASVAAWDAYAVTSGAEMVVDKKFLAGVFLGGIVPYWFASLLLMSIGKGSSAIANEVIKQFASTPDILEGTARPNYKVCVEIATKTALKTAKGPIICVLALPFLAGTFLGTKMLSGIIVGAIAVTALLGISTNTSGAAWMNASHYIFTGKDEFSSKFGGADGKAYTNSLMGLVIGLPLSEIGPCCNMLLKMLVIQSLVLSCWFKDYSSVGLLFEPWQ